MHSLVLTRTDFWSALLYGQPNTDLPGYQIILNASEQIILNILRYTINRIAPKVTVLNYPLNLESNLRYFGWPNKLCYQMNLGTLKTNCCRLPFSSLRSSTSGRLIETFFSRQMFINRFFTHWAPRTYNKLPYELRTIDDLSTLRINSNNIFSKNHMIRKTQLKTLIPKFNFTLIYQYFALLIFLLRQCIKTNLFS